MLRRLRAWMCVVWDISLGVQDFQVEPIVDQPCNDMVGEKGTLRDISFKKSEEVPMSAGVLSSSKTQRRISPMLLTTREKYQRASVSVIFFH